MSILSWGKCRAIVRKYGETGELTELPTPVEESTTLETTEGDKLEAKIEGGEYEDIKYKAATYALSLQIRLSKGRAKPIVDTDGVVADNYEIFIIPEDADCYSIHIPKASVSATLDFSTADGLNITYSFNALKPSSTSSQIEVGKATVTEASGKITAITIADME